MTQTFKEKLNEIAGKAYYDGVSLNRSDLAITEAVNAIVEAVEENYYSKHCSCGRKLGRPLCGICDNDD